MSYITNSPNIHDFSTALSILDMKKCYPGLNLISADGGFPFVDLIVDDTPVILGYKPDAICEVNEKIHIIEVKSSRDVKSSHSKSQFKMIKPVMEYIENAYLNVYVFNTSPVSLEDYFYGLELPLEKVTVKFLNEGNIIEHNSSL